MHRLSNKIKDRALLLLIRRYLQSGIMRGGTTSVRQKGTPQGSPLSPILSNIVLDELDKELEKRGHSFVRYADDFSIFVRSKSAGERVKQSISNYLTGKLKLKVNSEKSVCCESGNTTLLGHTILNSGRLVASQSSKERLKKKVKQITRRNRGISLRHIISELNAVLRGWLNFYKNAKFTGWLERMDEWIRRKLRCYRLKQCKRNIAVKRFLVSQGISQKKSWDLALSGKGWWRKSYTPQLHLALRKEWFDKLGLYNLSRSYSGLQN